MVTGLGAVTPVVNTVEQSWSNLLAGCSRQSVSPPDTSVSLTQARQGFQTRLVRKETAGQPVPAPPPNVFRTVRFPAPGGNLAAYLSPDRR